MRYYTASASPAEWKAEPGSEARNRELLAFGVPPFDGDAVCGDLLIRNTKKWSRRALVCEQDQPPCILYHRPEKWVIHLCDLHQSNEE